MHISQWFHHLFNPHCPDCAIERTCRSCDDLRTLLAQERYDKQQLLNQLLLITNPTAPVIEPKEEKAWQPIKPRHVSWSVKKEMLEAEDRAKAEILRKKNEEITKVQSIEDLEKELGVNEDV